MINTQKNKTNNILVLLIPILLTCCSTNSTPDKSCLWEVKSGQSTFFLFGMIDPLKSDYYQKNKNILESFNNAEILVTSFDYDSVDNLISQNQLFSKSDLTSSVSIKEYLTENQFMKVDEIFQNGGLDISDFINFKPYPLADIFLAYYQESLGLLDSVDVIDYFITRAKSNGLDIISLQSVKDFKSMYLGIPLELQGLYLQEVLEYLMSKEEYLELYDYWKSGNIGEIEKIMFHEKYSVLYEYFNSINYFWVSKIEKLCKEKRDIFVAVRLSNLLGSNGMINILEEKGYTIKQL